MEVKYTEDQIKSLEWREHIRLRPGMYVGKLGDGQLEEDGIYILLKEVVDNAIDEHIMGYGKQIDILISEKGRVEIRDFGRGVPLGKLYDCVAKINTGAKYDSEAFQRSVGLNGVGIKAVNALSCYFKIQAWRDDKTKIIEFSKGEVISETEIELSQDQANGTQVIFEIDRTLFSENTVFRTEWVEKMCRYYAYLNANLSLNFNGEVFRSKLGLLDLINDEFGQSMTYQPIALRESHLEFAFTHQVESKELNYTFVNGQNTHQGGTHLRAFREAYVKCIRQFYKKAYEAVDIRAGLCLVLSVRIEEPIFESQTKTKLGSTKMSPKGESIRLAFVNFLNEKLDNYLHRHSTIAELIQQRIEQAEKERKALNVVEKLARDRARQVKVHNKKLRDCRNHLTDRKGASKESMIFLTEGDSASGSITKSRDPQTQAVFSLRGKPLNCYGLTQEVIYENEEFSLLQAALGLAQGIEGLRYKKVILATDADVDGMHIRLLLMTFFLHFFPELIREGHLFILQTPLFRVRNKQETRYCYDEAERKKAIEDLGKQAEITRFKGLGEISPNEFGVMIGEDMRLESVTLRDSDTLSEILSFYMGKNTPKRQEFVIEYLRELVDV